MDNIDHELFCEADLLTVDRESRVKTSDGMDFEDFAVLATELGRFIDE